MTKGKYTLQNPHFNGNKEKGLNNTNAVSSDAAANIFYSHIKNMIKDDSRVLLFTVKGGSKDEQVHYSGTTKKGKVYVKKYIEGHSISSVTKTLNSGSIKGGQYYLSAWYPTDPYYYDYSMVYDPFLYNWAPYSTYLFDHHLWMYNSYYPYSPFYNSLEPASSSKSKKGSK